MTEPIRPDTWDRLANAFDGALARPTSERRAFLDETLGSDPAARVEVEQMLAAHLADGALRVERRLADAQEAAGYSDHLAPGTRVGSYRVESLVGEGGMGEVYRAERVDGEFRQTVAIKVLRAGVRSAEYARRFHVERQILARLTHPDIVTILDGGTTGDGRPYLVMPYVEGLPLTAHCDRHALSLADRLRLFRRVADAVQFAHGRLVVHRDLKPSNILVTAAGEPRLLDFGIAKVLGEADATAEGAPGERESPATQSALRLLTPEHAAPEQIRGDQVTTATDVYSLGVLLYQLVAGRRPFTHDGRSVLQLERAILEESPPPPSSVAADAARRRRLRGDLDRIVLTALRKEPDRRYVSAGQLAEDVERYLTGLPIRAEKDTFGYRARKFVTRNRGGVAAGVAFIALLGAFAVTSFVQARRVARERDRAQQQKESTDQVVALLTGLFERSNPMLYAGGDTLRVASLIADGERRVDSLTAQPELQARMWRVLGNMHAARGDLARSEDLLRRAADTWVAIGDTNNVDAASAFHELARAVEARQGVDQARPLFEASLARFERLLGPNHLDVAQALQELAAVTEDRTLARARLARAVQIRAADPTADSISQAASYNALGAMDLKDGRLRDAATSMGQSLAILQAKLPVGHPNRVTVMQNYATVIATLGDFTAADSIRAVLLDEIAQRKDLDSLMYVAALENLALTKVALRDFDSAEHMLRSALAVRRRAQKPTHGSITNTLRNLGMTIGLAGRPAEGLPYMDTSVAITAAREGEQSKWTAYLRGQRAMLLLQLGRIAEAGPALRAAGRTLHETLEPEDAYNADLDGWMAVLTLEEGAPDSAEIYFRRMHDALVKSLPADHPKVLSTECGVAVSLADRGHVKEAEPLLVRTCDGFMRWGMANPNLVERARRVMGVSPNDAPRRVTRR